MPSHIFALIGAIIAEVIGTSALQASQQFTRLGPSIVVVLGYGVAFYLLAFALKSLPVGVAYAVWSGLGIVLISLVGLVVFGQKLDLPAIIGIGLIIAGVAILQLFSGSAHH
ncbi:DMT family transporter [Aliiruegeria lutimaris]|uniref:Small multidrug resistance pump n=1 Tax=Aliiruegeria lutimaris TaxID=571298 RepID=A0A1G8IN78_9RHOB|nr:SMR family transporter [Aliiruegeria lutimaris]SDI20396.1 small multidrug resistance pump [Aliiruegeria lutimaris]